MKNVEMVTVADVKPRAMSEPDAAKYIGRTASWLKQTRFADKRRLADGLPPIGPCHVQQGRKVFYYVEDLDAWADQFRYCTPPGWEHIVEHNKLTLEE